jgi:predicted HAD superfamily Cof-like phosphohydrolase
VKEQDPADPIENIKRGLRVVQTHWAVSSDKPQTNFEMVQEFNRAIGVPEREPSDPGPKRARLRAHLMEEEHTELIEAMVDGDIEDIAKELADLLYVVYGTADEYGIPMDTVFAKVHISNMSKLIDGAFRADGKYTKGPNYRKPDLSFLRESMPSM